MSSDDTYILCACLQKMVYSLSRQIEADKAPVKTPTDDFNLVELLDDSMEDDISTCARTSVFVPTRL